LRALADTTEPISRQQPTVELLEDIHWADPTTLEVMDLQFSAVIHHECRVDGRPESL
jgi:predicted ATPase